MRRQRQRTFRGMARGLVVALAVSLVPAVAIPGVASAAGPSVPTPEIKPVPVAGQPRMPRAQDGASRNALTKDQLARQYDPGTGTPEATSLAPSASWAVSGHTGDFTWSYPMRVPPAAGGLEPVLGLSYRSSAVDGRTSVTNNQPSWIGDGWDLWPTRAVRTNEPLGPMTKHKTFRLPDADAAMREQEKTVRAGDAGPWARTTTV